MNKIKNQQNPNQNNKPIQESKPVTKPKTLIEYLETIKDHRRGQGRMHSLPTVLLVILMATMSGCFGQRATGDFVKRHHEELIKALQPKNNKLPSRPTITRVIQNLDFDEFSGVFFSWAKTIVPIEDKDWFAVDGKGIRGTVSDASTAKQRYTNLVSLFSQKTKQILTQGKVRDKSNEIPMVVQLVEQLGLNGLVITADALHCQKGTARAVIKSGNDYVLGVKHNQPKLYTRLKKTPETPVPSIAT